MEMSFLSGIYSKVLGTSSKKTEQTCSDSGTGSTGFTEAFDNEDGFVLYTPDQHKRYKVWNGFHCSFALQNNRNSYTS